MDIQLVLYGHAGVHAEMQTILAKVPATRLRTRPHSEMNSMVWSIWHSIRSEDACVSRFVVPAQQVLTTGNWNVRLGVNFIGDGFGMTSADVTTLSNTIDIGALAAYGQAVAAQTATVAAYVADWDLTVPFSEAEVRSVCATYADLAHDDVSGTIEYMGSMTKGAYLLKHLYGHTQYHLGEMSAIDGQIAGERFYTW
jgi:DinB superfamily